MNNMRFTKIFKKLMYTDNQFSFSCNTVLEDILTVLYQLNIFFLIR